MTEPAHICASCKWFRDCTCHRFPPQFALWPNGNQQPIIYDSHAGWPSVAAEDFCGEWKDRR